VVIDSHHDEVRRSLWEEDFWTHITRYILMGESLNPRFGGVAHWVVTVIIVPKVVSIIDGIGQTCYFELFLKN